MLIKTDFFVLFLLAYGAWFWLLIPLAKKLLLANGYARSLWASELSVFWFVGGLFAFIYTLSRFFSLSLVLVMFAGSQIGIVVSAVAAGFLGLSVEASFHRSRWQGQEIGKKYPRFTTLANASAVVALTIYPVIAGFIYFRHPIPSLEQTLLVFKLTLIALICSSYPFPLSLMIGMLLSKQLDEKTRTLLLVNSLSQVVMFLLYLAVTLYAFRVVPTGVHVALQGATVLLSPGLLVALAVVFLLFLFFYVAGFLRGKQWRLDLVQKKNRWHRKLLDVIDFPDAAGYAAKLSRLLSEVKSDWDTFVGQDVMRSGD